MKLLQRDVVKQVVNTCYKKWSTDKAFSKHLSELYGAYIHSFVSKFKDKHVITISLEIVNERYLKIQHLYLKRAKCTI